MESNFKVKVHQLNNGIVYSSIKEVKEEIKQPKHEQIKLDIPELPKVEFSNSKQKKGRKKKDV